MFCLLRIIAKISAALSEDFSDLAGTLTGLLATSGSSSHGAVSVVVATTVAAGSTVAFLSTVVDPLGASIPKGR